MSSDEDAGCAVVLVFEAKDAMNVEQLRIRPGEASEDWTLETAAEGLAPAELLQRLRHAGAEMSFLGLEMSRKPSKTNHVQPCFMVFSIIFQ